MKKSDLERFRKGKDLWRNIQDVESTIASIDKMLNNKQNIKEGRLQINSLSIEYFSIDLDYESIIVALETMKRSKGYVLEDLMRQFEAL